MRYHYMAIKFSLPVDHTKSQDVEQREALGTLMEVYTAARDQFGLSCSARALCPSSSTPWFYFYTRAAFLSLSAVGIVGWGLDNSLLQKGCPVYYRIQNPCPLSTRCQYHDSCDNYKCLQTFLVFIRRLKQHPQLKTTA